MCLPKPGHVEDHSKESIVSEQSDIPTIVMVPPPDNSPELITHVPLQINFDSDIIGCTRHFEDCLEPISIPQCNASILSNLTTYSMSCLTIPTHELLEIGTLFCHKRNSRVVSLPPGRCDEANQISETSDTISTPRWPSSTVSSSRDGQGEDSKFRPRKRCCAINWSTSNSGMEYTSPTNERFQLILTPNVHESILDGEPLSATSSSIKIQLNAEKPEDCSSRRLSFP